MCVWLQYRLLYIAFELIWMGNFFGEKRKRKKNYGNFLLPSSSLPSSSFIVVSILNYWRSIAFFLPKGMLYIVNEYWIKRRLLLQKYANCFPLNDRSYYAILVHTEWWPFLILFHYCCQRCILWSVGMFHPENISERPIGIYQLLISTTIW